MKECSMKKRILFIALLAFCSIVTLSAQKIIKVACIGNSITAGYGLQHPEKDSYPIVLGNLLGNGYEVRNFGVSATTMIMKGDYPYMLRPAYQEALAYNPDIVTIKLGTNDSKPQNWRFRKYFQKDLCTMIQSFRKLPSHPVIFLCYPATAYAFHWNINDSIIVHGIKPIIQKVAHKYHLHIIDIHSATANMGKHFPDNIHPDTEGAKVIAHTIYQSLMENKSLFKNKK